MALAFPQSPNRIGWKAFSSAEKPLHLIFFGYYSFNTFLAIHLWPEWVLYLSVAQEKGRRATDSSIDPPLQHMALTSAALSDSEQPDSVRHTVKCSISFDKFFIVI